MASAQTKVLKYILLPGLIPRAWAILTSGFAHTSYTIALIYHALGLLPPGHPYVMPENFGRFGIRHVIAAAANNLVFSRRNIDQIIIFFTVLGGMALLIAQFVLLIIAVMAQQPALAATAVTAASMFSMDSAFGHGSDGALDALGSQDIAFIIMDRVFGVEGIFNSCISLEAICRGMDDQALPAYGTYPKPFHIALHTMLRFYSMGIFVVGVFIILYFLIAAVAETAASGSPFGQRFNKTWAPVRLILFFALLVPLNIDGRNAGLNAAQLLTFATAKIGSNFATNAWGRFNGVLTTTYLGEVENLIATPNVPELSAIVKFMFVAKTCKIAEEIVHYDSFRPASGEPNGIQAYLVRELRAEGEAVVVPEASAAVPLTPGLLETDFHHAINFSNYGNIYVRIGSKNSDSDKHRGQWGNVYPDCGEIVLPITKKDKGTGAASGSYAIQALYYLVLQQLWNDATLTRYAECTVRRTVPKAQKSPVCTDIPDKDFVTNMIATYQEYVRTNVGPLVNQQITNADWSVAPALRKKGWAGAAIWYNRIAGMNGEVTTAIYAHPVPLLYPAVMHHIADAQMRQGNASDVSQLFETELAGQESLSFRDEGDRELVPALQIAISSWDKMAPKAPRQENIVIDAINIIYGTSGIFDIRKNATTHPLAQLSTLGKGMMEASVRNFGIGLAGGGFSQLLPGFPDKLIKGVSGALQTVGLSTMAMSFALYYILPVMPFIYFLFAVSGWVKTIFEAIVAMPLWALSHIVRMDGNGIPGPAATNGYFLLFEIFLRPVLIVFGLLASITIFSSLVVTLNSVFDMVVNAGGFDQRAAVDGSLTDFIDSARGPIDEFFYTAVYVIIVYMMGLSCFKLIDLIPNNMLRWAGVSVSTFQEGAGDPAGQVMQKVYSGGLVATNQLKGGALAAIA